MIYEINPFHGVGKLSFGESRDNLRRELGGAVESFRKTAGANETDAYDDLGMHLYFDNQDRLEFVELFEPAQVVFRGVKLIGRDAETVKMRLAKLGWASSETDIGYQWDQAGFSFFPQTGEIEGVGVFRRGYYDED